MNEVGSLKELERVVNNSEKVYLYGAGKVSKAIITYLDEKKIMCISGIIVTENSEDIRCKEGIDVYEIDQMLDKDSFVIIGTSSKYKEEIESVLINNGFNNFVSLSDGCVEFLLENMRVKDKLCELSRKFDILEKQMERLTPRKRLKTLVINICDHCNLNCMGCDHFSPIADSKFYDVKQISNDLKRLHEIIGEKIDTIGVMGGEPLLHPNLCEIMTEVRQIFPTVKILLCSNGIALLKQSDEFWECCRKNEIEINITKYPINFDYDAAEKKAKENDVKYMYYHGGLVEKTLGHYPLDLEGTQDATDSFVNCFHANNTCNMIFNGRLYPCTIAPCMPIFNRKYNKQIPLTDGDGVDLYKVESEKELFDNLSRPMSICSYCDTGHRTFGHEWKRSEQSIAEWT